MSSWQATVLALSLMAASPASAAVFGVDSTLDEIDAAPGDGVCASASGACTLRAAVMEANALAGEDTIEVPPGRFLLAIPHSGEDSAATGDLDVTDDLLIVGAGAGLSAIEAEWVPVPRQNNNLLEVHGTRLGLHDLELTNRSGVAVYVGGTDAPAELEVVGSAITGTGCGWGFTLPCSGGIAAFEANLRISDSTISRNDAVGLLMLGGTGSLVNSTVSGHDFVCGKYDCEGGRAIMLLGASLSLTHSTVAENTGDWAVWGNGSVTLADTIVANDPDYGGNCDALLSITSYGHNLDNDGSCGLTDPTDLPNTDPMLGPLQDNGGPTWTHALLPGSPARDAIPVAECTVATDQRGIARPQWIGCDIGAFEAFVSAGCGLGPELAVLLPALLWLSERRRRWVG